MKYAWLIPVWAGFLFSVTQAAECPSWLKTQASQWPSCPSTPFVPETYPVGAVVVSDRGMGGTDSGFTSDFVQKVLRASGDHTPMVLLPVSEDTMARIQSDIDHSSATPEQKQRWKQSLVHVNATSYTWQQDYFESFVNPQGQVVLRPVSGYERPGSFSGAESLTALSTAAQGCGMVQGDPLKSSDGFVNGMMGGNIDAMPGGICLLGDDHFTSEARWSEYADQFCGKNANDRVKVPTAFLNVGHTDEVMKIVRNKNAAAPCDFSIEVASPRKALELLRANSSDPFLSLGRTAQDRATHWQNNALTRKICRLSVEESKKSSQPGSPTTTPQPRKGSTKLFFELLKDKILGSSEARAGATSLTPDDPDEEAKSDCPNLTNGDVARLLTNDQNAREYNEEVQREMDALKQDLKSKLKSKLPQCTPDFIDAPDLFMGGAVIRNPDGTVDLPEQMGDSVLPNPTNAVSIENSVIAPEPGNDSFKKYMTSELQKRGLKADFVDTYEYAHVGQGNLHCSTHTIQVCSPSAGGR